MELTHYRFEVETRRPDGSAVWFKFERDYRTPHIWVAHNAFYRWAKRKFGSRLKGVETIRTIP